MLLKTMKRITRDNNRLHTEHSAGVLPESACLSCPVNLARYPALGLQQMNASGLDSTSVVFGRNFNDLESCGDASLNKISRSNVN